MARRRIYGGGRCRGGTRGGVVWPESFRVRPGGFHLTAWRPFDKRSGRRDGATEQSAPATEAQSQGATEAGGQPAAKPDGDKPADKPAHEFAPSLLDEAAQKPATDAKPGSRHATAMTTIMSALDAFSLRKTAAQRSADEVAGERKELLDDFRATGIANRRSLLHLLHWFGETFVKEGTVRPAPPPRTPAPTGRDRGLRRYQNMAPAR